jgi:hypothetical protein
MVSASNLCLHHTTTFFMLLKYHLPFFLAAS